MIAEGRDAIFAAWDPLPYLGVYHLQIPALLVDNLRRRRAGGASTSTSASSSNRAVTDVGRKIIQLAGSPVDEFHAELSRLYARASAAALVEHHRVGFAYVAPGGTWQFPDGLDADSLAAAEPLPAAAGIARLAGMSADVVLPQLFCHPGMTSYRALLDVLGLPYLGNTATVMANTADKAVARALVAAHGVAVPAGRVVTHADEVDLSLPVVVKPARSDNSMGCRWSLTARRWPPRWRARKHTRPTCWSRRTYLSDAKCAAAYWKSTAG